MSLQYAYDALPPTAPSILGSDHFQIQDPKTMDVTYIRGSNPLSHQESDAQGALTGLNVRTDLIGKNSLNSDDLGPLTGFKVMRSRRSRRVRQQKTTVSIPELPALGTTPLAPLTSVPVASTPKRTGSIKKPVIATPTARSGTILTLQGVKMSSSTGCPVKLELLPPTVKSPVVNRPIKFGSDLELPSVAKVKSYFFSAPIENNIFLDNVTRTYDVDLSKPSSNNLAIMALTLTEVRRANLINYKRVLGVDLTPIALTRILDARSRSKPSFKVIMCRYNFLVSLSEDFYGHTMSGLLLCSNRPNGRKIEDAPEACLLAESRITLNPRSQIAISEFSRLWVREPFACFQSGAQINFQSYLKNQELAKASLARHFEVYQGTSIPVLAPCDVKFGRARANKMWRAYVSVVLMSPVLGGCAAAWILRIS